MRLSILLSFVALTALVAPAPPEELRSIAGLPAHIAGSIDDISACHLSPEGDFLIFDRRAHAVYSASPRAEAAKKIVQIGAEPGRLFRPSAFASASNGTFVVADSPGGRPRFQFFFYTGEPQGGFTLPGREIPLITMGDMVISGIGSLSYSGTSVLISQPETGSLVTEYSVTGQIVRSFGQLRNTGQERDRDVHVALNAGVALPNPKGGYYFVFLSGPPMFRKYDAQGRLVFERHVEGIELDQYVQGLPTTWPRRTVGGDELPLVPASIRTAAVDPDGNLWISLAMPYTYVYDGNGDKRRTIQFRAAGIVAVNGFFFTKNRRILVTPGCYLFPPPS